MEMIDCEYAITDVEVIRFGVLALTFEDGLEGEVDLSGHIWGPVFERVRTPEGFNEVYVNRELGTVTWPGEVDLAPDTLYIRVKTGEWPPGMATEPTGD
jgi:hypothetical protein